MVSLGMVIINFFHCFLVFWHCQNLWWIDSKIVESQKGWTLIFEFTCTFHEFTTRFWYQIYQMKFTFIFQHFIHTIIYLRVKFCGNTQFHVSTTSYLKISLDLSKSFPTLALYPINFFSHSNSITLNQKLYFQVHHNKILILPYLGLVLYL